MMSFKEIIMLTLHNHSMHFKTTAAAILSSIAGQERET